MNSSLKILVVEDAKIQREICIFQLKELGFKNITGKADGIEALKFLQESPVDLVISDWMMPNMDGLELLRKIKGIPSLQNLPFILLTVNKKIIARAMESGVTDFIPKPGSPELFQEKIQAIFH